MLSLSFSITRTTHVCKSPKTMYDFREITSVAKLNRTTTKTTPIDMYNPVKLFSWTNESNLKSIGNARINPIGIVGQSNYLSSGQWDRPIGLSDRDWEDIVFVMVFAPCQRALFDHPLAYFKGDILFHYLSCCLAEMMWCVKAKKEKLGRPCNPLLFLYTVGILWITG